MGDVNEDNRKKHFGLTKRRYRLLSLIWMSKMGTT
jgi:hypothetical protein